MLRREPRHAFALVIPKAFVQVLPVLRLFKGELRSRVVVSAHLGFAQGVGELRQPCDFGLGNLRLAHHPLREPPGAFQQIRPPDRVQGLGKERREPVPQPNNELRFSTLHIEPAGFHRSVRGEPRRVVRMVVVPGLGLFNHQLRARRGAGRERGAGGGRRVRAVRRGRGRAGGGDQAGGFQPSLRKSRRAVLGAEKHRRGKVVFAVGVDVLQVRGSAAKHVETLEAVLHGALHAPA